MSAFCYPKDFVPPNKGDIIYNAERVPKTVFSVEDDKIILQSLTGRKFTFTFFEYNQLVTTTGTLIFKKCEITPKNMYIMLSPDNSRSIVFIKHIDAVNVEMYIRADSSIIHNNYEDKITVGEKEWYKVKTDNIGACIFIPVYEFNKGHSIRWPKRILSTDKEILKQISEIIKIHVENRYGMFSRIDRYRVAEHIKSKITKYIVSNSHLKRKLEFFLPNNITSQQIYTGDYNILEGGGPLVIDLESFKFEYLIPKIKCRIQEGSSVKYISNKINIRNINEYIWVVTKIKRSLDNPNLDQCIIISQENVPLQYTVFRKELKLIKQNKIIYEGQG